MKLLMLRERRDRLRIFSVYEWSERYAFVGIRGMFIIFVKRFFFDNVERRLALESSFEIIERTFFNIFFFFLWKKTRFFLFTKRKRY